MTARATSGKQHHTDHRPSRDGARHVQGTRGTRTRPFAPDPTRPSPERDAHQSCYVMIGMIRSATMLATLIIGLIAGPAVSLNGSPTVSPVTAAA